MVELSLKGICKRFGATAALSGVDLEIRGGQVHALLGENGAGKSTLMKVLSGATTADEGEITLDQKPFAPLHPADAAARGVAMIYQELSLLPNLTVAENIVLGREPRRGGLLDRKALARQAHAALAAIDRTDIPLEAKAGSLSVSVQQAIEIAKAVASGARVLIFDEPTSSATRADVERLFKLIRSLKERRLAVVFISHFLEEVKELCDVYTVLRDGRTVGTGEVATATEAQLISLMVGRDLSALYPRSDHAASETLLEVRGPGGRALEVRRGEVLGIAGLVGSGRTELLRAIAGLDALPEGTTLDLRIDRAKLGLLSEDRKDEGLALLLSVAENIVLSRPLGPTARKKVAARYISELGIKARAPETRTGDLSGGNQQKVALARLLHHDAELFLLDEPTRGIDVAAKATIYETIDKLARSGRAVVLVSSYLPELLGVCDRIAVMARGRLGEAMPATARSEAELIAEALA